VFAVVVIAAILSAIAANIISLLLSFLPDFLDQWLGSALSGAVVAPFMATAVTLMYLKLADRDVVPAEPAPAPSQPEVPPPG
jgi:uncharacterized membrane protein YedE/YeeE